MNWQTNKPTSQPTSKQTNDKIYTKIFEHKSSSCQNRKREYKKLFFFSFCFWKAQSPLKHNKAEKKVKNEKKVKYEDKIRKIKNTREKR